MFYISVFKNLFKSKPEQLFAERLQRHFYDEGLQWPPKNGKKNYFFTVCDFKKIIYIWIPMPII